jgi:hypothetical protein
VRLGVDAVKMLMPWNTTHTERTRLANRVGKVISVCDYAFSLNRKRQVASKWAEPLWCLLVSFWYGNDVTNAGRAGG